MLAQGWWRDLGVGAANPRAAHEPLMLRRLGHRFESFFRATTPDPFVLAVGLTLLVLGLAAALKATGPLEILRAWQGDRGFWSLLAFSMQMVLILVTGHALAATPVIGHAVRRLADVPRTGAQAAALVAAASIACALLNWGLGLIVGALLAREVGLSCARRGVQAHYPLLVAAGYAGMMCWHGGLSGTAPLEVTTFADLQRMLGAELAATLEPVPFTETVLGLENFVVTGGLALLLPLVAYCLAPRGPEAVPIASSVADRRPEDEPPAVSPARRRIGLTLAGAGALALGARLALGTLPGGDGVWVALVAALITLGAVLGARPDTAETVPEWLERSPWTLAAIGLPLVAAVAQWLLEVGVAELDPNAMNLAFLAAGLLLHGSLARYARAIGEATAGASGIVLQFPLYAGIMGVMRSTGLARDVAEALARAVPSELYTTVTFLSAGVVNLFVPSGGGQWAIQGPVAVEAARALGVPLERAVMAVAYGDQWTNMLQPFWALPLLAITGIRARDILGYTTLFMLVGGLWIVGCLLAFSL